MRARGRDGEVEMERSRGRLIGREEKERRDRARGIGRGRSEKEREIDRTIVPVSFAPRWTSFILQNGASYFRYAHTL